MTNASNIPRSAIKQEKKAFNASSLKVTPQMSIIEYNDVKNPKALYDKIKEFSEKGENKLTEKELGYIERIATLLENSSNYHSWKLDFKEVDAFKKVLSWPR